VVWVGLIGYLSSAVKDFLIRFQDSAYVNVNMSLMFGYFKITAWNILYISRLKTTNLANSLIHHNFVSNPPPCAHYCDIKNTDYVIKFRNWYLTYASILERL